MRYLHNFSCREQRVNICRDSIAAPGESIGANIKEAGRNNGKGEILAQIALAVPLFYFEAISRRERRAKGTGEIQSGLCLGFVLRSVKRRQLLVNISKEKNEETV